MRLNLTSLAAAALCGSAAVHASSEAYDYIVVGGGPTGIITATRLAEANKKVLLLERGKGPTVDTGANYTLSWNSSLTPVDVPGLSSIVSSISATNYFCDDTVAYGAVCVLGGGATINYMVFVHPSQHDFERWPTGWQWADVAPAAERFYSLNAGSTLPSQDGVFYDAGLYNTLAGVFGPLGWTAVDINDQPDEKHEVYSHPGWNIKNALRAGPVRTYLPQARQHDNFSYRLRAKVTRLLRASSRVTGVEVEDVDTGAVETIGLSANGRVILAAGALSTPRLLFHSGIGPADEIRIANQTGVAVPPKDEWISLPVGHHLQDHPVFLIVLNTSAAAAANSSNSYTLPDTASMLNGSAAADIAAYEDHSAGILTQGRHRLMFFTSRVGTDGVTRYYQGSCAASGPNTVTITSYLTHGTTSTGVLGLKADDSTYLKQSPYLQTTADKDAATAFVEDIVGHLTAPSTGFTLSQYLNVSAILATQTKGSHYSGTTKIGTDDGRFGNGTSVVDLNTKVYGTDNLFIVDAGIHPDLPTGNNQAIVMIVAEAAVAKILAYSG